MSGHVLVLTSDHSSCDCQVSGTLAEFPHARLLRSFQQCHPPGVPQLRDRPADTEQFEPNPKVLSQEREGFPWKIAAFLTWLHETT